MRILTILLFVLAISGCKREEYFQAKLTSREYDGELLYVDRIGFQIETSARAEFSSPDTQIVISRSGVISKIAPGAVCQIDINWVGHGDNSTRIYALGSSSTADYKKGWQSLKQLFTWGYSWALVFRHGDIDHNTENTQVSNWWKSCDSKIMNQLNDKGKTKAAELGKVFKDLHYPVSKIVTSEFCRAKNFGELMGMSSPLLTDARLNDGLYNPSGKPVDGMFSILRANPGDFKLSILIAHSDVSQVSGYKNFPTAPIPFGEGDAYAVSFNTIGDMAYQGCISYEMFTYWRDLKLKKL